MVKKQKDKFGTIDRLPSEMYRARYRLRTGEQVSAGTFATEELAQQRLDEIEVDLRGGEHWDDRRSKVKGSAARIGDI